MIAEEIAQRTARHVLLRRLSLDDGLQEAVPALNVRIADVVVAVRSDDAPSLARIVRALRPFLVSRAAAPDARLDLRVDRTPGIWADESPEPRATLADGVINVEHRDFVGVLSVEGDHMVVVHPRHMLAVENALRVLYALLLVRNGGVLLHAAGVVREPGASVLFGRSGSGKTTVARMARGRALLGDDLVALRRTHRGWVACSTPFGGEHARTRRNRAAGLSELLRLRHGDHFEARPMAAARGVAALLQSVVLPASIGEDRRLALERCLELQREVGVQELTFPLDNGLWRWLDGRRT